MQRRFITYKDNRPKRSKTGDTKGKELLIMTIEIEEGKLDQIVVHENENAITLAQKFCEKHNLNKKL